MPPEKNGPKTKPIAPPPKQPWQPPYEVCRKLPDGSREVITTCSNREEAQKKARALRQYFHEQYFVHNLLAP